MEKNERITKARLNGGSSSSSPPSPDRSKAVVPSSPPHSSSTDSSPPPSPPPASPSSPPASPSSPSSPSSSSSSMSLSSSELEEFFGREMELSRKIRKLEEERRKAGIKKPKKERPYYQLGQAFDRKSVKRYLQQIQDYEGFYVEFETPLGLFGEIGYCNIDDDDVIDAAKFALEEYNKANEGKNLEFKRVVRVNMEIACCMLFYITLEASNGSFYEAKVEVGLPGDPMNLYMIRPALYYPGVP